MPFSLLLYLMRFQTTHLLATSKGVLSYVRDTGSTTGICATGVPPCLGSTTVLVTAGAFRSLISPMLDPTTGKVFVFVGDSGVNSTRCRGRQASYVVQANMDLTGKVFKGVGVCSALLFTAAPLTILSEQFATHYHRLLVRVWQNPGNRSSDFTAN